MKFESSTGPRPALNKEEFIEAFEDNGMLGAVWPSSTKIVIALQFIFVSSAESIARTIEIAL